MKTQKYVAEYIISFINSMTTSFACDFFAFERLFNKIPPQNNWVPRRDEEGPKVIRQIHVKAGLAPSGREKGGIITEKEDTRCQPLKMKAMPNPEGKPSTLEQESSGGNESEHSDLTSTDGDQSHRNNNVPQWFERPDLNSDQEDCLLGSAHHRGQLGGQSGSSGDSAGSEKPEIAARATNRLDRFGKWDLTLDHEKWHHRCKHHTEKLGRNRESSKGDDRHFRKDEKRGQLDQSDSLTESQSWRVTRKNKSPNQESSRYRSWCRRSDHEKVQLEQFGSFAKSQNWPDPTTFKSSGREISGYNNWHFKVDHERHRLDHTDHLCNSQSWRVTSNNESADQESSWYNNWRFKRAPGRDQQNRSEHVSHSQGLPDTRASKRSGPSNARSNCERRKHQSKTSHINNRQRNNRTFKRVEDTSNNDNWQATKERKQLVQKILNLDSEKWRIRPDRYRSDCNFESEKWSHRDYRDRDQSDHVAVKHKLDAREVINKRLIAKESEKEMEKVTLENKMTKELTRLLRRETSNRQLTTWIEVSYSVSLRGCKTGLQSYPQGS